MQLFGSLWWDGAQDCTAVERSGHEPVFGALGELTGLHLKICNNNKAPIKPHPDGRKKGTF